MVPPRILLVDDDDGLRRILAGKLQEEGCEVREASNGQDALNLYDCHGADIVILDILMPAKDGLEVIMELRRRRQTPCLVAMSGGGLISADECLSWAKAFRVDFVLKKPFSIDDLLKVLGQILGWKESVRRESA
jgi:CheY-like chemotaxis protein